MTQSGMACLQRSKRTLHCSIVALAALLASPARAADHLTVAIYAPNAPFDSGEARYSFVSRLAQQIQAATGIPTEPKAYARASDFEAAAKKGQVDLAVIDAVYVAERGLPYPVMATATAGGEAMARWWLFVAEGAGAGGLTELEGKRLAFAATGARDGAFVDNGLLDGELPKLFGGRQPTPDVASAVTAVSLHKADAVFAPEAAGKGLKKTFDAGRLPNPALVQVNLKLDAEVVDKVKAALGKGGGGAVYDGWKIGAGDAFRALAGRMSGRVRRPLMAEPPVVALDPVEALVLPSLDPALPELRGQFWMPGD